MFRELNGNIFSITDHPTTALLHSDDDKENKEV